MLTTDGDIQAKMKVDLSASRGVAPVATAAVKCFFSARVAGSERASDVVSAITQALRPGVRGIFNLAGPAPLPLSRLIGHTGRPRLTIPHFLATGIIQNLWRYRVTSFPAPELDHIRYICMVDDRRARQVLGFTPRMSVEETVRSVDDGRW